MGTCHPPMPSTWHVRWLGALPLRPAAPGDLMHRRHLQLAAGEQVVDAGLVEGVNAAWIGDYLLGDDSPRQRAASLVLGSFVSSPFMTELRTRQQLGYIVGASASVSLRERWLTFVIQSSTHASMPTCASAPKPSSPACLPRWRR
jgi:insulysin